MPASTSPSIAGFGEIAEQLRRSTVLITTGLGTRGNGSGVIWSSDGIIITNAHVARSRRLRVQLWDAREFDASVWRFAAARDPFAYCACAQCDTSIAIPIEFIHEASSPPNGVRPRSWLTLQPSPTVFSEL